MLYFAAVLAVAALPPPPARALYSQLLPSVALIDAGTEGRGTGWVIDTQRRWLVTSFHVVGDAKTVDVLFPVWKDGELIVERSVYQANFQSWRRPGKVLRRDPQRDLALVEVESLPESAKALPLAAASAGPGDAVWLLGNRRDLDQLWSFTAGHVGQAYRGESGFPWRTQRLAQGCRVLVLQAPVNDGDSGGPVVNGRGELVGVTAAILYYAQRTAAIDAAEVRAFLFPDQPPQAPTPARDRYPKAVRAVAWVQSPSSISRATGWVFDRERRLLLTTAAAAGTHELVELIFPRFERERPVAEVSAYKDVPRVPARVVARDSRRNLALLEAARLPDGTVELPISAESARPGDALQGIANPGGVEALWVHTALSVRQVGRVSLSSNKEDGPAKVLVLQAPAAGNDSGGPVFDAAGRVVAVAGGKEGPEQQVSYAVDAAEVRDFLKETAPRWKPETAAELHQRGRQQWRVRWLEAARDDFRAALRLAPDFVPIYGDLADLLRTRGESKEALEVIRHALERLPPGETALILSVRAALQTDLEAAVRDCDAAIKIDPKCARAFAERAELWRRKKELDKALKDADESVWLDASLARAYVHRGRIQIDRRDWPRAVADLGRAAELDPFDPAPLLLRATVYDEIGEAGKAKADRAAAAKLK